MCQRQGRVALHSGSWTLAHLLALRCLWVRGGVSRPFHFAGYGAACSCPEGGREAGISELDESAAFACMILHETQKRGPHSSS